jgi:hypothetical protein
MSVPEPVPEILLTTKLLQRKVLLVILVTEKLSCRSEIPCEEVFREPCHSQTCGNLNQRYGPVLQQSRTSCPHGNPAIQRQVVVIATTLPSRRALISRIGGRPKSRLYSRLNWLGLS